MKLSLDFRGFNAMLIKQSTRMWPMLLVGLVFLFMNAGCTKQSGKHILLHIEGDEQHDSGLGAMVDQFADIDGDGFPEIIAASPLGGLRACISVYSGRSGVLIYRITSKEGEFTTRSFAVLTDLDGDKIPEIAIPSPSGQHGLWLFSGKDGKVLFKAEEELLFTYYGRPRIIIVPDKNDDSVPDIALERLGRGLVVFSGKDGRKVMELNAPRTPSEFVRYDVAPDINGDGLDDLIGITRGRLEVGPHSSKVVLKIMFLSAADFSLIDTPVEVAFSQEPRVWRCADVNGDGMPDVIFGSGGILQVVSGKDGREIWRTSDTEIEKNSGMTAMDSRAGGMISSVGDGNFADAIALLPDMNGDSIAEVAAGHPAVFNKKMKTRGGIYVFSGKDGTILMTVFSPDKGLPIGASVAAFADWNRDGTTDILVGAPSAMVNKKENVGAVLVMPL
jgi:hypothetical protein